MRFVEGASARTRGATRAPLATGVAPCVLRPQQTDATDESPIRYRVAGCPCTLPRATTSLPCDTAFRDHARILPSRRRLHRHEFTTASDPARHAAETTWPWAAHAACSEVSTACSAALTASASSSAARSEGSGAERKAAKALPTMRCAARRLPMMSGSDSVSSKRYGVRTCGGTGSSADAGHEGDDGRGMHRPARAAGGGFAKRSLEARRRAHIAAWAAAPP